MVSIFLDETIPVFLIAGLSKGDRKNFTDAEVADKSARRRTKKR